MHLMPHALKAELARSKDLWRSQTFSLKAGPQKRFFARVWGRLHVIGKGNTTPSVTDSTSLCLSTISGESIEQAVQDVVNEVIDALAVNQCV